MIRLAFITTADRASFAGTLATVNSILQFHPDAQVSVVCDETGPPTPSQCQCLSSCDRVSVVDADTIRGGSPEAPDAAVKARACRELGADGEVVAWIDPGCVLCSPVDDVAARSLEVRGVVSDAGENPSIIVSPVGGRSSAALLRWADGRGKPEPAERLDARVWCPRESHWDSIVDFREGRFVGVSSSGVPQRMFQSDAGCPFWSRAHRNRVLDGHGLQTYPYVWFLAMLWFGRCGDWTVDPHLYLPEASRHLLGDLIHFLPQIEQVLPRARYRWNALSDAMIERALDGIPRCLSLGGGSMDDVMELVAAHPWIRRYVEIGSYLGGSILALGLRFLNRDIDFYAVESFMGSLDGTMDGFRLPSRRRFLAHLARHPGLRVRLVPGDSAHAAELFDDGSLDCVFIDACHETCAVMRDIDAWMPKLAHPAILAGDDYGFDSVYEAVNARFSRVNITQSGSIWWVSQK